MYRDFLSRGGHPTAAAKAHLHDSRVDDGVLAVSPAQATALVNLPNAALSFRAIVPQAGPISIIPSPGAPGIAANVASTIVAAGNFTVAPGTVDFADALAKTGFAETSYYGRFLFYDANANSTVTNNGVLWNRVTDGALDGDQSLGIFTLGGVVNTGKIVVQLNAGTAYGVNMGFAPIGLTTPQLDNSGQIFALTDSGSAFAAATGDYSRPVVNSGLLGAHAGTGIAEGLDMQNGGLVTNAAGGAILAEGVQATAVEFGRGTFIAGGTQPELTNAGLIEAVSLDPNYASIGVLALHAAGEKMEIVNSGTIEGDYAIYASFDGSPDQKATETVTNLTDGHIAGVVFLGLGDDVLVNHGTIDGIVDMGEGNDHVDLSGGTLNGYTDLGFGDDVLIGSSHDDDVLGNRGDDQIDGGAGQDLILAGYGNDTISGGAGSDGLYGEFGNDTINAGAGDYVSGGPGDDRIQLSDFGGFGGLHGDAGFDTLVLPGSARILDMSAALAAGTLDGIEAVELGHDTGLVLRLADVVALSDTDSVTVRGDASNTLYLVGGWSANGQRTVGGVTYNVFHAGASDVLLQAGAAVAIQASAPAGAAGFDPAPGIQAPQPNPDFLAGDVTVASHYMLDYSLEIYSNETWKSENGAPVFESVDTSLTLTNAGTIESDGTAAGGGDAQDFFLINFKQVTNTGSILATAIGSGNASGVFIGAFGLLDNSGTISAVAQGGTATAVYSYDQHIDVPEVRNTGTIFAHSDSAKAIGVGVTNARLLDNEGTITATGPGAVGVISGWPGEIDNHGSITATSSGGLKSVAVQLSTGGDTSTVVNTGTIHGDIAISGIGVVSPTYGAISVINSGTIQGDLDFVEGSDHVVNTGTIVGAIDLAGGNDIYDSRGGHQSGGAVNAGDGNDTIYGSDDDETFIPGAGDDFIDGGGGNDTVVLVHPQSDFTITHNGNQTIVTGPEGTDTYVNVENIVFHLAQPQLIGGGNTVEYVEHSTAPYIDRTFQIVDAGSSNIFGATVVISAGMGPNDDLRFTSQTGIFGSYDYPTRTLTFTGKASLSAYQDLLRSVRFVSNSLDPTVGGTDPTRTIQVSVYDGVLWSNKTSTTVHITAVNDPPDVNGYYVHTPYLEGAGPVIAASTLYAGDGDNTTLVSAKVWISSGYVAGDVLSFTPVAGITSSFDSATHTLSFTGTAPSTDYKALLDSVTFDSTSGDPDNSGANPTRTLSWQADDGQPLNHASLVFQTTIDVTAINSAPALAGAGVVTGYTEQAAAIAADSGIVVADPDTANLAGATVAISAGFVAGDTLNFSNQNGITGVYNAATHVLTLTGASSVANYQAALRSVTFSSASDNPDNFGANPTRTIVWQVDDGQPVNHASATVTTTLAVTAVDDLPAVRNDAFATSEQAAIGSGLNVFANNGAGADSDPDNLTLTVTAVNGAAAAVGHQIALASGALLTLNANGTFAYDPNHAFDALAAPGSGAANTSGTDSFTYTINGTVETATVTIAGVDSNDTLIGTSANNSFDGGTGTDTVVFTGSKADYTIAFNSATSTYTVVDNRGGSPDGTDTVKNVENFHFADGTFSYAVYSQTVTNGDGSTTTTSYDAAGDAPWASQVLATDTAGSLATQTVMTDGGSKWTNGFDTTGTQSWTSTTASYDAANNQLTQLVNNDDGSHALTLFDVANAYRWSSATIAYDANWNVTGVTGTNDDGSHTIAMKDVQAALDTALWFAAPYDANQGQPGAIVLSGGGNADYLYGGAGNDTLSGGGGNDLLSGGGGNDTLSGGAGDDRFVFHNDGSGLDVITDFTAGNASGDLIELHAYGIASFAALQPFMAQVGADVVIAFDPANQITLQHVTLASLNAGDFAFS